MRFSTHITLPSFAIQTNRHNRDKNIISAPSVASLLYSAVRVNGASSNNGDIMKREFRIYRLFPLIFLPFGCYAQIDLGNDSSGDSNTLHVDSASDIRDSSSCGNPTCGSQVDHNCNGIADGDEITCDFCNPGTDTIRECNTHPGMDGVGACRAGAQTCIAVGQSGFWSPCAGDVEPSIEACGPTSPDTNCNGVQGDGDGCLVSLNIYFSGTAACNVDGHFEPIWDLSEGEMVAGFESPEAGWSLLSSFQVFTQPFEGTVPIRNCRTQVYTTTWHRYVVVGNFCENLAGNESEDLGVIGYVSQVAATGYTRLSQFLNRYMTYVSDLHDLSYAPVSSCPSYCLCSPSNFYVAR